MYSSRKSKILNLFFNSKFRCESLVSVRRSRRACLKLRGISNQPWKELLQGFHLLDLKLICWIWPALVEKLHLKSKIKKAIPLSWKIFGKDKSEFILKIKQNQAELTSLIIGSILQLIIINYQWNKSWMRQMNFQPTGTQNTNICIISPLFFQLQYCLFFIKSRKKDYIKLVSSEIHINTIFKYIFLKNLRSA